MSREHTIISALGPTPVPVPPVVGLCTDDEVNGAPFYVMDFVNGTVVRSAVEAAELSDDQRAQAGKSIVDVLAEIHAVDVDAVGLGELGRKEGYVERQLKRWHGQWEDSKTRELRVVDEVHRELSARVPDQGPATIVHGDYRLDNCMVGPRARSWPCSTGDLHPRRPPRRRRAADGLLGRAHRRANRPRGAPTSVAGFPARAELLDRYAAASGRDLSQMDFYVAFGYWKLACIVEGVYARYIGGAMGGDGPPAGHEAFAQQVDLLAEAAAEAVAKL